MEDILPAMAQILKRSGWDWTVTYRFDGEEIEQMAVFGAMTPEAALSEARHSLSAGGTEFDVLGRIRTDAE